MSESGRQNGGSHASSPADLVERGRALHRSGSIEGAEQLYREALAQDADYAEAYQLLAVIAGQRGRFDDAIAGFRRTIALDGPTADRLFNLAEAYRVTAQFQPAFDAYNQVLTIDASYLDAYRSGAEMAKAAAARAADSGDLASAERLAKLAAHYLVGLGHALLRAQNVSAAEQAYRDSIALDEDRAESYNCLGAIALEAGRPIEAEALCRRAHALEPKSPLFLNNLGRALLEQVRTDEAADLFKQAIEADPSFAEARTNLEERILPWLHYRADLRPGAVYAAHREWGRIAVARAAEIAEPWVVAANSRRPDRLLKIGYVGVDISSRLTRSFVVPLLANHDPREVNITVYATSGSNALEVKSFKRQFAGRFQPLVLRRTKGALKMMRDAGVDILIDIAGHLPHNRLDVFALKPAPVTITWLGYPDTTGLSTIDYRITDDVSDPPGAEELYTEQLYRLSTGSCVYRPPERAPEVAPLPGRATGAVTFGNFDDPRKISPPTVSAWSSILRALPMARLLLLAREFADTAFAARVLASFQAAGIAPDRLELRRAAGDPDETLRAYAEVDISLDTFPYNGALTTICEALWMGVPVITLSGDRPCARTSTSLLAQVGLERLDSHTAEEYAETAVELAGDLDRLEALRSGMRERMRVSPLMDERGFARRFEAALRDMWQQWCKSGI
ncbi:MAG TPA: tetratricopeptide repeat protein [Stellaceae bacterium]|nr:tetratricopeptide repeat protein [Stellaceae bacterium]